VYKILSKLVNECWRYSKPKQCHFWAWLKRPIFGVHDSQGSAETLVRRGGITNYYLMTYSFNNISAKNYQNRLMCIEVIVCNVTVVFIEIQCKCDLLSHLSLLVFLHSLLGETWTPEIWSLQSCCVLKITLIWLATSSTFINQFSKFLAENSCGVCMSYHQSV